MVSKYKAIVFVLSVFSLIFLSLSSIVPAQTWTQLSPTGSVPTTRFGNTAVYDVTNNKMIIFGGSDDYIDGTFLNDVWVLSTANGQSGTPHWTQLSPTGSAPSTRQDASAIYDSANNRMTIYGGYNNGLYFGDLWVLSTANGTGGTPNWIELSATGGAPETRAVHSAVYDSTNNLMIVFGGYNAGTFLNDVWVLSNANGLGGTPNWTQLFPTGTPPATRYGHSAVYDNINNLMIVFGGYDLNQRYFNDVWVLSNANGQGGTPNWTQLNPTGSAPTTRNGQSAVYDSTKNRMIIFGGSSDNGTSYLNDAWVLTHANGVDGLPPVWTQQIPTGSSPTTRFRHTAIYDSTNNLMTIFGGWDYSDYFNDTWVLSDADTVPVNDWMLYGSRAGDERVRGRGLR